MARQVAKADGTRCRFSGAILQVVRSVSAPPREWRLAISAGPKPCDADGSEKAQ